MRPFTSIVAEALLFLAASAALGLAANALHPAGLALDKDYFQEPDSPFATMTAEEVRAYAEYAADPGSGIVVLDARRENQFRAGRIPGSVFCDPYNVGAWLPALLPRLQEAVTIVVYCNGGDCEDSKYMARELSSRGIPVELISIYLGGYEEWLELGYPVEQD